MQQQTQRHTPYIATDIIIEFDDGKKDGIVLITRKNFPHGIALPGGFAEYGLSLEQNAVKEAKEETGLDVILLNDEMPLCVNSDPRRDPRAHVISVTYVGRGHGTLEAGDDAKTAAAYSIDEAVRLVQRGCLLFDHGRILNAYFGWRNLRTGGDQDE